MDRRQIKKAFGVDTLPRPLFYNSNIALRFELAGDSLGKGYPLRRFRHASSRAEEILNEAFDASGSTHILLQHWLPARGEQEDLIAELSDIGLRADNFKELPPVQTQDEEPLPAELIYESATQEEMRDFLWLAIAADLGIKPSFDIAIFLIDLDRQLAMLPYDDRGMDLIGASKSTIAPLYRRFNDYLLEYDRSRMDAMFSQ